MLEGFGRRRLTGALALLAGALVSLGMAQTAQAGTLTLSSGVLSYEGSAGNSNATLQFCAVAEGACSGVTPNRFRIVDTEGVTGACTFVNSTIS